MAAAYGYGALAAVGPQGRWRRMMTVTVTLMLCVFVYYNIGSAFTLQDASVKQPTPPQAHTPLASPSLAQRPSSGPQNASHPAVPLTTGTLTSPTIHKEKEEKEKEEEEDLSMAAVIKALYRPMLHPVDAANFTDEDGKIHRLGGEPRFKKKLGKNVLILDIDSRALDGEGQLMNEELKWGPKMRPLSAGMLSHYMFGALAISPKMP
jgi:hypothetical protein